jgi:hypothetical protein
MATDSDPDPTLESALYLFDRLAPLVGGGGVESFKRIVANLSVREWSSEPGTFRARLEEQLDSALRGRLELDNRTAEACVLNSLRCLRDFIKTASTDPMTLGSEVGVAARSFAEGCSSAIGMERFVEELIQTPGLRSMKFVQGFSHLCAAADPEPDGRGTEARMRSCAQTFVSGLEAVTKPLWLACARLTAAANAQSAPSVTELGRIRARLEQLWNSAPPPDQKLISIIDQRVTTIRNAACHDGIAFLVEADRCQFVANGRSLELSETQLRAIADERVRFDYTLVLALGSMIIDQILRQLRLRRGRLRGETTVLQLAKGGGTADAERGS